MYAYVCVISILRSLAWLDVALHCHFSKRNYYLFSRLNTTCTYIHNPWQSILQKIYPFKHALSLTGPRAGGGPPVATCLPSFYCRPASKSASPTDGCARADPVGGGRGSRRGRGGRYRRRPDQGTRARHVRPRRYTVPHQDCA